VLVVLVAVVLVPPAARRVPGMQLSGSADDHLQ
jgi:hypothetical protein